MIIEALLNAVKVLLKMVISVLQNQIDSEVKGYESRKKELFVSSSVLFQSIDIFF